MLLYNSNIETPGTDTRSCNRLHWPCFGGFSNGVDKST